MKLIKLIIKTRNEKDALELAKELQLVDYNIGNCECGGNLKLDQGKLRNGLNTIYRCGVDSCRKRKSILKNTIFENSKFKIGTTLIVIYLKLLNITIKNISNELDITEITVTNILKNWTEKIATINLNRVFGKLGFDGDVVECDETHLVSRRDCRGRINTVEKYWLIGAISRTTKQIRLKLVRNRNANVCLRFLTDNVNVESTVFTDGWRGYNSLNSYGFEHMTINHRLYFVDPDNPIIHTQNIESLWAVLKSVMPKFYSFEHFENFINYFVYVHNSGVRLPSSKFNLLIVLNKFEA